MCDNPRCLPSRRVLQWVVPAPGAWRVASRMRASRRAVSFEAGCPRWRLYSTSQSFCREAPRPARNVTVAAPSWARISAHPVPAVARRIQQARRASSARPLRLATRRSSSMRSGAVSVIASSSDALILPFQLLHSTSALDIRPPRLEDFASRVHRNDDGIAPEAQDQPFTLRLQVQDHARLVLHPEIAGARRADGKAVAGLAIGAGELGSSRRLYTSPLASTVERPIPPIPTPPT